MMRAPSLGARAALAATLVACIIFVAAQTASAPELIELIGAHPLSWEMLPDTALGRPEVWRALVEKGMPQTALMRQLPTLTRLGVLDASGIQAMVIAQLTDQLRWGNLAKSLIFTYVFLGTQGADPAQTIDAREMAAWIGTIPYDPAAGRAPLVTALGPNAPRSEAFRVPWAEISGQRSE